MGQQNLKLKLKVRCLKDKLKEYSRRGSMKAMKRIGCGLIPAEMSEDETAIVK